RLGLAHASLKWRGLSATLASVARRKMRLHTIAEDYTAIARIALAFERCNAIATPLDQCLPRSIAVAHRMIDRNTRPTLVIGVRAQPFAAHCWIECDDLLVNDRYDTVRAFTPIFTL
ncbi:MAG: lasso peptide biosynthesis B2 protein, partial [Sphingomonas sp.]